jgi:hypothetical protein
MQQHQKTNLRKMHPISVMLLYTLIPKIGELKELARAVSLSK